MRAVCVRVYVTCRSVDGHGTLLDAHAHHRAVVALRLIAGRVGSRLQFPRRPVLGAAIRALSRVRLVVTGHRVRVGRQRAGRVVHQRGRPGRRVSVDRSVLVSVPLKRRQRLTFHRRPRLCRRARLCRGAVGIAPAQRGYGVHVFRPASAVHHVHSCDKMSYS